ncbi:MAG: phage portal protein, partial [Ktedonobacterales bacterium]|nr:phage portal protein [Ktedonobacterales bacterium]
IRPMSQTRRPRRTQQPTQTRKLSAEQQAAARTLPTYLTQTPPVTQAGSPRYRIQGQPRTDQQWGGVSQDLVNQMQSHQAPQEEVVTTFAPGAPLIPAPDIGTPRGPRLRDYPIAVNTNALPRAEEVTTFAQLRAFADLYYAIPLCKRVWFDVLSRLDPHLTFDAGVIPDGEADTDPKWQKILRPAQAWIASPDGEGTLTDWMIKATNDILDLGQAIIYINRANNGDVLYVEVVAADTIKLLYDQRGKLPTPPWPAFEQIVHGVGSWLYTTRDMRKLSDMERTSSAYSRSRVEDIWLPIQVELRKQTLDLSRYTDGATPAGFLLASNAAAGTTSDDLQLYEEIELRLNGALAGNDQVRSRLKVLPPEIGQYVSTQMEGPQTDFDHWNLKITCAAFGVTPAEIGFTDDVNRASSDGQENVIYRRVIQPLAKRFALLFTAILKEKFDQRLCLEWAGIEEVEDEFKRAQMLEIGVKNMAISPSDMARLMKWPVKKEIEPFMATQSGLTGIVTPEMIAKAAAFALANQQSEQQSKTAALQQQQLINQQMQRQQEQQQDPFNQELGAADFGAEPDEGDGEDNGGQSPDNSPAPPLGAGGNPAVDAEGGDATPSTTGPAAAQVDQLIAQARQGKGKAAQRATIPTDPDAIRNEWRAWREKALRAAKSGEPQPCWRAASLPDHLADYAHDRLQGVVTPDEVRAVFAEVRALEMATATRRAGGPVFDGKHRFAGWVGGGGLAHSADGRAGTGTKASVPLHSRGQGARVLVEGGTTYHTTGPQNHGSAETRALIGDFFGRDLADHELASLVGAQPGMHVTVEYSQHSRSQGGP